ncbi:MAG: ComF family protein [Spirochaetales bacterium]
MKKVLLKIKNAVVYVFTALKKAIFVDDIKCITCGKELDHSTKYGICDDCLKNLPYNDGHICYKCGDSIPGGGSYCLNCKDTERDYEFARAPFLYEGKIKTLIYKLKYNTGKYLAPYISYLLLDEFIKQNWHVDMVVPVPLYKGREKRRGFNQAELISCKFNEVLKLPIETENLIRKENTPTQTRLSRKERKKNLLDAFEVLDKTAFKNKDILLIDDVFTTGATTEECSKVLKKAGARNIYILTLAHVKQDISYE